MYLFENKYGFYKLIFLLGLHVHTHAHTVTAFDSRPSASPLSDAQVLVGCGGRGPVPADDAIRGGGGNQASGKDFVANNVSSACFVCPSLLFQGQAWRDS